MRVYVDQPQCKADVRVNKMEFEKSLILEEIENFKIFGAIYLFGHEPSLFENKNSEKSLKVRKQANQLFAKKNHDASTHEQIWKLYTKSIAYASDKSEELSAGYANRSALLLHLKKYNECLLDVDRALKTTDSNALKVKLYCRQSECSVALQDGREKASFEKANFWLKKIDDVEERMKLKETIEKTEKAIKADAPDSVKKEKEHEISCENDAISMNYSEKYGRHLIANRDICLGELVYEEKMYATSVNTVKFYAYCSHCLAISWATIPCDQCSFYMYCSEKCKTEAWQKYHDIECSMRFAKRPNFHESYIHLALRLFIMGFKETGSIIKLKALTKEVDNCKDFGKKGLTDNDKFSGNSFKSVYSLSYSKYTEKVQLHILEIVKILVAFARNTDIFGKDFKYTNNIDLMNNENAIFTACLLLRLSSISVLNAFEVTSVHISCKNGNTFADCRQKFCCPRGLSMSLFTSLINHSCDNNVDKFYTNDGRVVYYAMQPIKKNSQIFSSYYCKFMKMSKPHRQELLSEMYEFRCDCVACRNDWPNGLDNLPDIYIELGDELLEKHAKTFEKLSHIGRKHRFSMKAIRSFIQDTDLLLKSSTRPIRLTEYFLNCLCLLIEHRYFMRLDVPSTCKNNSNK